MPDLFTFVFTKSTYIVLYLLLIDGIEDLPVFFGRQSRREFLARGLQLVDFLGFEKVLQHDEAVFLELRRRAQSLKIDEYRAVMEK